MTKIRDIIQIDSGYTSYVDLQTEYFDLETNQLAHKKLVEKQRERVRT